MKHFRLEIEGMGCAHCVRSVTEALAAIKATVNDVQVGSADVLWDGDTEELRAAVADAGFEVKSIAVL
ncbi:MAG TPA: heavy-metal-associated domain-containing protein [Feifaniaceae bacterium]|nr:heavy-metal-associated domain-containing protein [Feifaniaceae bacterium]